MSKKVLLKKTIIGFINNYYNFFIFFFFTSSLQPISFLLIIFLIAEILQGREIKNKLIAFLTFLGRLLCLSCYFLLLKNGYFTFNFVVFILSLTLLFGFLLHSNLLNDKLIWGFWLIIGYFCYLFYSNTILIFFLILTFILMKFDFFKKETFLLFKKNLLILSFLGTFILLRFFLFFFAYNGENPEKILQKIKQQKEIKKIFTLKDKSKLDKITQGGQIFFVGESYDKKKLFLGMQGKGNGIIMFNKKNKKITVNEIVKDSSDNMDIDCEQPYFYIGDHKNNNVYYFSQNNIYQPKKIFKLSTISPTFISKYQDKLYINTEDFSLHIVDTKKGKEVKKINNFGMYSLIYKDGIVNHSSGINIYKIKNNNLQLKKKIKLKLALYKWFARGELFSIDAKRHLLFYPSFSKGVLYIIDLTKSKLLKTLVLEKGVRYSSYNPKKNLVFVVGYINGGVYVIDSEKKKIVKKFYVGPRARNISFSCDGTKAFVASSIGAFEINVNSVD